MTDKKPKKLFKVASEFNVATQTIVDSLGEHDFDVANRPNTKITPEMYEVLSSIYGDDKAKRQEHAEAREEYENRRSQIMSNRNESVTLDSFLEPMDDLEPEEEEPAKDEKEDTEAKKPVESPEMSLEPQETPPPAPEPEPKPEEREEEEKLPETTGEETGEETPAEAKSETKKKVEEADAEEQEKEIDEEETEETVAEDENTSDSDVEEDIAEAVPEAKESTADTADEEETEKTAVTAKEEEKEMEPESEAVTSEKKKVKKRKRRKDRKDDDDKKSSRSKSDTAAPSKKTKKSKKRSKSSKVDEEDVEKKMRETMQRMKDSDTVGSKRQKRRKQRREEREEEQQMQDEMSELENEVLDVTEFITVSDLADLLDVKPTDVITTCMNLGMMVSINQRLDAATIELVAEEFDYEVNFVDADEVVEEIMVEEEDDPEDLEPRSPIITVMGHVDHGKTSLLDYIRKAKVAAGEAGGITQNVGAYEVKTDDDKKITFLDTPGHEAFTAMLSRGAQAPDIVILVVAADDAVMPQTIEAINHSKAAGVSIVVAINKMDKPGANPDKIKQQLSEHQVIVEEYGGETQVAEVSAETGDGIDDLLEKVLIEAELLELKANPDRNAQGIVLE